MPAVRALTRLCGGVLGVGALTAGLAAAPSIPAAATGPAFSVAAAVSGAGGLAIGDPTLSEARTVEALVPGVNLVRIVRGAVPATPQQIPTTTKGPWRVNVLTIDPSVATGRLVAGYGADLARTETTSALTQHAEALAGTNASFFTFHKNPAYPGDPVGLGLYAGQLLSEPGATASEVDVLVDSRTGKLRFGRLGWSGRVRNTATGATLALNHLNSPPKVPTGCTKLADPTTCTRSGDVVHFVRSFATSTPSGRGVEVVLDKAGCVVRRAKTRGVPLAVGQAAVQATGSQSRTLYRIAPKGRCLSTRLTLRDSAGKTVTRHAGLFGVAGRYRLTQSGKSVVPTSRDAFFSRHPRTLIGSTANGVVMLVTIDGRQTTSVGASLKETAAVALSLGLTNSVNLDGGGSTTMIAGGSVVNQPSGGVERAVGDALVYLAGASG